MSTGRTRCDCCGAWQDADSLHWSVGDRVCELCWQSRIGANLTTPASWISHGAPDAAHPFRCWHGTRLGREVVERA
jgi:hypothetical protein